ncbi:MAG: hypothetical protein J6Q38_01985 [Clostridia bacterium]|nr:hypothetical protein [Clostridia bacterium]
MEILKIIAVGVIGAISFVYLKSLNSELSGLLCIGTSIVIVVMLLSYIIEIVGFFNDLTISTGINSKMLILVIKITAISYLVEFTSNLCDDLGAKSIGSRVEFAGRIITFVMGIPVFSNLISVLTNLII